MEEGKSYAALFSFLHQLVFEWSVIFLVLLSMTIQVILVLVGANRHRTANPLLRLTLWICYIGADFVATSALGAMTHYSRREIVYAIWASMMMVHLGGPDTITAYSIPDNNLWKRHCFNMLYQGFIAAYVVYVSAVEGRVEKQWYLLSAAFLMFIVGVTKYGERAWALWLASPSQIVSSVQPIHNYMKIEHALGLDIDELIPDNEIADVDKFREHERRIAYPRELEFANYQYIVAGEEWFVEDDDNGDWSESIVTIKDVWEYEEQVVTDNYLLCVSHALFKMYKRRFASLRFHEATLNKTKRFFSVQGFSKVQVFNILEMELKFIYDYLFSKSSGTAFSQRGAGMRVVSISLLGLCWFVIVQGLQETEDVLHGQRTITYILMCVALGLEVFQLGRIILSDWSMVWLLCVSILQSREQSEKWWRSCTTKLIWGVTKVVARVRKMVRGNYWQNRIPQLCVIETCFSAGNYSYPLIRSVLRFLPFKEFMTTWYISGVTAWHIDREFDGKDTKEFILVYYQKYRDDLEAMLRNVKKMLEIDSEEESMGSENVILGLHLATSICYQLDPAKIGKRARWVSRYFAYLLVTCPGILPVEPENGKELYREVFLEITDMIDKNRTFNDFCKDFSNSEWKGSPLRIAKRLVTEWLEPESTLNLTERWHETLYLSAVYDRIAVQGERLTVGGEFLTLLWALLGHLGMAEESYIPTALQRDPKQE